MLTLHLEDEASQSTSNKSKVKKQKLVKHRRKNWSKTDIAEIEEQVNEFNRQKLAGYLFRMLFFFN